MIDAKRHYDKPKDPIHFYMKKGPEIYNKREKGTMPLYMDVYKFSKSESK